MQNKSAVLLFTILLALATLYTLSFNWVSSNYEKLAEEVGADYADSLIEVGDFSDAKRDSLTTVYTRKFLRDSANAEVYPVFGHTYNEVKQQELNLGLDLKGGMSVTLEVSIPDLVKSLSDYSDQADFNNAINEAIEAQSSSNSDFITLFDEAWQNQNSTLELRRIFFNPENSELFPANSTDEQIIEILRAEAQTAINNTENIIRKRIDQFGVAQPNVQKMAFSGRILVELPGVDDRERVRQQLKSTANLEFWETLDAQTVFGGLANLNNEIARQKFPERMALVDSLDNLSRANPQDTTIAPLTDFLTQDEIREISPIFSRLDTRIANGIILGAAAVTDVDELTAMFNSPEAKATLPPNAKLAWDANPNGNAVILYCLLDESGKGQPKLDGKSIIDASHGYDQIGKPAVNMSMDAEGTQMWAEMTQKASSNGQRPIAIVLDNRVISAPSVRQPIEDGSSQITFGGAGTLNDQLKEAEDLAGLLKAGSLPAPAKIVDEVSVGASLGEDNIQKGLMSFIIALLVVLIYMIFYYKGAGLVSDIALIANLFFLIGALAALGAALTLPGIAGIVLTIGMAVDANVLIYERIKEEMRNGKGLNLAVKDGYSRAYSAIIDANITTLLTAVVLKVFGSGPILGFANTLIIGIFTSLFSAIVLTRLIFFSRLEGKKAISFYSNLTKDWFTKNNFQFVAKRKLFYGLSLVIIIAGVASLATKGLKQGVDFSGGTSFDIAFVESVNIDEVRSNLSDAFTEEGTKGNPTVQSKETDRDYRITTNFMMNSNSANVDEEINAALASGLAPLGVDYEITRYNKVDGNISDDFRRGATYATIFALLVIFLYLVFRFRKWQFGLGALIAMVHDVLIVLSLFSIFGGILPFTMEIDQAFIAAILTVIGYSINDTVVVFDRIREYLGLYAGKKSGEVIINDALNSTLSRTINTSVSTFIVLLIIFLFGGDNIKGFVFALLIGVVVGTYSSIFIATPSVLDFSKNLGMKK